MTKRERLKRYWTIYHIKPHRATYRQRRTRRFLKELPEQLAQMTKRIESGEMDELIERIDDLQNDRLLDVLFRCDWKKPFLSTQMRLGVYGHRRRKQFGIKRQSLV